MRLGVRACKSWTDVAREIERGDRRGECYARWWQVSEDEAFGHWAVLGPPTSAPRLTLAFHRAGRLMGSSAVA